MPTFETKKSASKISKKRSALKQELCVSIICYSSGEDALRCL